MSLLQKELRTLSLRPLTHGLRVVCGLSLLGVLVFYWFSADVASADLVQRSFLGRQLYVWLFLSAYLLGVFVLPPFLIGAILEERDRGTLDLLRISPLSNRQIVIHKLFSRLVLVGSFCLAGLPLTSMCLTLGGVAPVDLGLGVLRCVAGAVLVGSFALDTALRGGSIRSNWLEVLFFLFVTPLAALRFAGCLVVIPLAFLPLTASSFAFPFHTFAFAFSSVGFDLETELPALIVAVVGSAYYLRQAARHVRQPPPPRASSWRRRERFNYARSERVRRRGALQRVAQSTPAPGQAVADDGGSVRVMRRKRRSRASDHTILGNLFRRSFGADPFLDRAIQRAGSSLIDDFILAASLVTVITTAPSLLARFSSFIEPEMLDQEITGSGPIPMMTMVCANVLIAVLVTAAESSRALLRLRRGGMLPVLLSSPLRPVDILRGLTLTVFWQIRGPLLATLLIALAWVICGYSTEWALGATLALLGTSLVVHAVGTACSMLAPDEGTSLFATGLLLFGPLLGSVFLLPAVDASWMSLLRTINPFLALAHLANPWTVWTTAAVWLATGLVVLGALARRGQLNWSSESPTTRAQPRA